MMTPELAQTTDTGLRLISGSRVYEWRLSTNHEWIQMPEAVSDRIARRRSAKKSIEHEEIAEWLWDTGFPNIAQRVVNHILESRYLCSTP
jgi:hypothetical protein